MLPILYRSGDIVIPTYYLIISLTFTLGVLWISRRAEKFELNRNMALDLCLAIMVGGFVGARMFHVVYEYPDFYLGNPSAILSFWLGGYVFFGGFAGALAGALTLLYWRREGFHDWADLFAPVCAFGYSLGRLGCLAAGCCYGASCDFPWAIVFPEGSDAPHGIPLHPTQLYASFWEAGTGCLLLYLEKKRKKVSFLKARGAIFFSWLILHAVGRLIMEHFRADPRGMEILGLSVSTIISFLVLVSGILGLVYINKRGRLASHTA